jgi:hypothetical protein
MVIDQRPRQLVERVGPTVADVAVRPREMFHGSAAGFGSTSAPR